MDILPLILVVISILVIFLVIMIIKKLMKFAIIIGLIALVIFLITGGSIIGDYNGLKGDSKEQVNSSKIVLLENNGNMVAGFLVNDGYGFISDDEIGEMNRQYTIDNIKEMLKGKEELIIIKTEVIDKLSSVEINNKEVSSEQIVNFLVNNRQIGSITYEDLLLGIDAKEQEMNGKAALFAYVYENKIRMGKSPVEFFEEYKEGNIIVYPESIFYKFTKLVPISWIDKNLNKLKESVVDKAKNIVKKEDV